MPVQTTRIPDSQCLDGMQWTATNVRYKRFSDVPPGALGRVRISFWHPGKKKIYPLMRRLFSLREFRQWVNSGSVGGTWNAMYKGRS
jgi:hypothetical protein